MKKFTLAFFKSRKGQFNKKGAFLIKKKGGGHFIKRK